MVKENLEKKRIERVASGVFSRKLIGLFLMLIPLAVMAYAIASGFSFSKTFLEQAGALMIFILFIGFVVMGHVIFKDD